MQQTVNSFPTLKLHNRIHFNVYHYNPIIVININYITGLRLPGVPSFCLAWVVSWPIPCLTSFGLLSVLAGLSNGFAIPSTRGTGIYLSCCAKVFDTTALFSFVIKVEFSLSHTVVVLAFNGEVKLK